MKDTSTRQKVYEEVEKIMTLAEEKGLRLSISLIDLCGHFVFFCRNPESPLISIEVSQKKAYSSYAMKLDTKEIQELTGPGKPLFQLETSLGGKLVSFPGGIYTPQLSTLGISAIGVSGSPDPEDDDTFARELAKNLLTFSAEL